MPRSVLPLANVPWFLQTTAVKLTDWVTDWSQGRLPYDDFRGFMMGTTVRDFSGWMSAVETWINENVAKVSVGNTMVPVYSTAGQADIIASADTVGAKNTFWDRWKGYFIGFGLVGMITALFAGLIGGRIRQMQVYTGTRA